jgi:hypothetical protein
MSGFGGMGKIILVFLYSYIDEASAVLYKRGVMPPLPAGAIRRLSLLPPLLGQVQQLKDNFGSALAILCMFGFLWGVLKIWSGANAISKGDPDGKGGIVAGIIIASATAIMAALYSIFGMSDSIITPRFN